MTLGHRLPVRHGIGGRNRLGGYAAPAAAVAVALFVANAIAGHSFLASSNWNSIVSGATVVVLLAMAQAPAVICGRAGVDLSVGPTAGLVNAVIVVSLAGRVASGPGVVIPVALAIGVGIGLVNGLLIAVVRLPAIVATLGTYLALGGLTLQVMPQAGGVAPAWLAAAASSVGPIPALLFVIAGEFAAWQLLMRTSFRRNLYAIGSDERAAYVSGVNVVTTRVLAYVCAGALAAVGGLALTAVLGSGDPTVAPDYTLQSIAAVALGGVALTGGRGGLLGASLGAVSLFFIQNLLTLAHVDIYRLQIVYGVVVLAAVSLNSVISRRREHQSSAEAMQQLDREPEVSDGPKITTATQGI